MGLCVQHQLFVGIFLWSFDCEHRQGDQQDSQRLQASNLAEEEGLLLIVVVYSKFSVTSITGRPPGSAGEAVKV